LGESILLSRVRLVDRRLGSSRMASPCLGLRGFLGRRGLWGGFLSEPTEQTATQACWLYSIINRWSCIWYHALVTPPYSLLLEPIFNCLTFLGFLGLSLVTSYWFGTSSGWWLSQFPHIDLLATLWRLPSRYINLASHLVGGRLC
jgi:hypothetical protein